MKKILITLTFVLGLVGVLSFSTEKVVEPKRFVLKEDDIVVEQDVVSEQTQLIQGLKEEVDELCDTTYKLNRLLIKDKQGDQDVRHTESRTSRSRNTNRGRNVFHFTTTTER